MMREPRIADIVPAIITPFTDDFAIDDAALESLAGSLAGAEGVGAVFCTGHAGEVSSLSRPERRQVVQRVASAVGGRVPVIAGVYTDNLTEAVDTARDAREAGASAVTVFPPPTFADGAMLSSAMPVLWHRTIAEQAEVPIVLFQYSRGGGLGYSLETLAELAAMPQVVGLKEGSGTMRDYEANYRLLSRLDDPVPVLTSQNSCLLASLSMGADGILSGSGSVVAEQHAQLWACVKNGDLKGARAVNDQLYPIVQAIYQSPAINMHTRIKEALLMLGRVPCAAARPPLLPISASEREEIRAALEFAGLLG